VLGNVTIAAAAAAAAAVVVPCSVDELTQAFSLDRITKSAAVFDKVKLNWMNGQHLR
jgi:glutamyl/glutaminyl-tRNA synthetase